MTGEPDFTPEYVAEVKARTDHAALIGSRVRLVKRGRLWVGLCPFHNERGPSFTVYGDGRYHCYGCGAHGDVVSFVTATKGIAFPEAVRRLAIDAGMADGPRAERKALAPLVQIETAEQRQARKADDIRDARELWKASQPAGGTLAETYLRWRGIMRPVPPTIRFHPAARYTLDADENGKRPPALLLPAMVAAVQDVRGRVTGVHRTFVHAGGQGKADVPKPKRMRGECWGGACRLTPAAEHLALGEGIETAASVLEANPDAAAWAALSLGNICGAGVPNDEREPHPTKPGVWLPSVEPDMERPGLVLPPMVKRLTILEDAKGDRATTRRLLQRAVTRFERLGLMVAVATPPDGLDFNDLLLRKVAA